MCLVIMLLPTQFRIFFRGEWHPQYQDHQVGNNYNTYSSGLELSLGNECVQMRFSSSSESIKNRIQIMNNEKYNYTGLLSKMYNILFTIQLQTSICVHAYVFSSNGIKLQSVTIIFKNKIDTKQITNFDDTELTPTIMP